MINEDFNEGEFRKTGKLFTQEFENRSLYAYHGTSVIHSNSIESSGLVWPFHPLCPNELIKLAQSANLRTLDANLYEHLMAADKPSTRISLAPYSYLAALHAHERKGGQVVGLCKLAIDMGSIPSPRLKEDVDRFFDADTCVYAIDISGFQNPEMIFQHGVFLTREPIPKERIKAKIIIPKDVDISSISSFKSKFPAPMAFTCTNSIAAKLANVNN